MKKLQAGLLTLGLVCSLPTFAFSPDCCNLGSTPGFCSPKLAGGFYVGVGAYDFKPSETGLGQSGDSFQSIESTTPALVFLAENKTYQPRSRFNWGFTVGYDIPCTPYNVEFNYFNLHSNTHAVDSIDDGTVSVSFASTISTNVLFPVFPTGAVPGVVTIGSVTSISSLSFNVDQADIKLGHQFYENCGNFKFQASLGARYGDVKHKLSFNSPAVLFATALVDEVAETAPVAGTFSGVDQTEFQGVGPMLSLDLHYGMVYGIGLVGRFNSSIMVGTTKTSDFITSTLSPTGGPVAVTTNTFQRPNVDNVVPNFDGKIGLDYTLCFCNKSSLTLEVGYQASKYWDAFSLTRGDISFAADAPAQRFTDVETTSFAIRGPYATLSYHI